MNALLLAMLLTQVDHSEWTPSLDPDVVATYLDGDAPSVVVVVADAEPASTAAGAGMENALKQHSRVKLVMNGVSLGDVKALGDSDIAKAAKGLPIDTVVIIRTFSGAAVTLVATFYGTDGVLRSALTVVKGKPLVARQGGAGRGVSSTALTAVKDATGRTSPGGVSTNPAAPYDGPDRMEWLSDAHGFLRSRKGNNYVDNADFYRAMQREDLARSIGGRRAGRGILMAVGLVGTIGGTLSMLTALVVQPGCYKYAGSVQFPGKCVENDPTMLVISVSAMVAGVAAFIVRPFISEQPLDETEQKNLVNEFNNRGSKPADGKGAPPVTLRFGLTPTNGGLLAALAGAF